jgi:LEA14-like dessication related protein
VNKLEDKFGVILGMTNDLVYRFLIFVPFILMSCTTPKPLVYTTYKNFSIQKLGFTNSEVKLNLEYFNPNNFGLQLRRSELDIFINNTFLGHSASDTLIMIPRRDSFLLPVRFSVDMRNLFKNTWNTFAGKDVSVKVTGKLKIGKANVFVNMPVNYEGKYSFSLF